MDFISYGKQHITDEDIQAVAEVLRSDYLTQGPVIARFEEAIADYVGSDYAVACVNATAALHLCCMSLDVGKEDIVWTSPISFVASANCALYCGAKVDFVDINPQTYNMDMGILEEKLRDAKLSNTLPKVVIPVHFSGQSCDMQQLHKLSLEYGFYIIEDASHAVGASYQKRHVGSCQYSDMSVFSFHPVKIITTGEGGIVTTNNSDLAKKLSRLRTHGITRDVELLHDKNAGPWYYEQLELGFNYRITDIQCALGLSQLTRIGTYIEKRRLIRELYDKKLADLEGVILPYCESSCDSSWHLYVIQVINADRKAVFESMRSANIGVNVHYIPIHLQPYYKNLGFQENDFPNAENYYNNAITLPLHPQLEIEHIEYICDQLSTAIKASQGVLL
jgi:UDP-4-amino-4,6-dideoxy-N-acetyl-beta-L-altrosamine transaminase